MFPRRYGLQWMLRDTACDTELNKLLSASDSRASTTGSTQMKQDLILTKDTEIILRYLSQIIYPLLLYLQIGTPNKSLEVNWFNFLVYNFN